MKYCLIVDFGSQYTQLIARRLRELQVFTKIVQPQVLVQELQSADVAGVILSGGPMSVLDSDAPRLPLKPEEIGKPLLGICYGMQYLAAELGGRVERQAQREYGMDKILSHPGALFPDESEWDALMSHGDHVAELPAGFECVAKSSSGVIAAMENQKTKTYALQFHPEVSHTPRGGEILKRFLERCEFQFDWKPQMMWEELSEAVTAKVKDGRILCAVSGGVDSTVLAVVLNKIFPGRVDCLCVDSGLLRKGELVDLRVLFEEHFQFPIEIVDASRLFLDALKGVVDPEEKRKIIGRVFIEVFEEKAKALDQVAYLAQGTLYPDKIESISPHGGVSKKIKSHHNVGGLPERLPFKLLEPFEFLFKDEVRRLGSFLGMPDEFLWRHPFPGPGLAVRVIGEVLPERLARLREADACLQEILKGSGWYSKLWQSFCVYLPVQSVGVMGDERTYEDCVAVRCVQSEDAMTARVAPLPPEILERISNRIINRVSGLNRVVYDISSKPPATIEWE